MKRTVTQELRQISQILTHKYYGLTSVSTVHLHLYKYSLDY